MKKIKQKRLVNAARDLNKSLGLEPPIGFDEELDKTIPVEKMSEGDLIEALKGESEQCDGSEKLADDTWAVFKELGVPVDRSDEDPDEVDDSEEDVKPPKKAAKKAPAKKVAAKKVAAKKAPVKKAPVKKAPSRKTTASKERPPSNKEVVYKTWKNGKGETDAEKLHALVKGAVKLNTIKIWIAAWKRGDVNYLPACAKK